MSKISLYRLLPIAVVAGLTLPVASQVTRSHTSGTTATHVRIANSPYTAEYKITHVQVLADGTTLTRETTEVKALDSQGRRMNATTITSEAGDRATITHVMVYDPVARTQAMWKSPGTRATVTPLPAPGAAHGCSTMPADQDAVHVVSPSHSTSTTESLGTASIQGVDARGRLTTTTTPAGAVGNDAPLVMKHEVWTAVTAGLNGLIVRAITDNPRSGKSTTELTNLNQSDPDPATFQPPDGYEIVTRDAPTCETGPTTAGTTSTTH